MNAYKGGILKNLEAESHSKVSVARSTGSFLFYASLTAKLSATRDVHGTDCLLYS